MFPECFHSMRLVFMHISIVRLNCVLFFRRFVITSLLALLTALGCVAQVKAQSFSQKSYRRLLPEQKQIFDSSETIRPVSPNVAPLASSVPDSIDPAFSASITEGSGYVNETVVQPDQKIIAVGLFQRAN